MINSSALLKDLKGQLKVLQKDLRERAESQDHPWGARLREEYDDALARHRTGHSWVTWRDNEIDQAAVAWLVAATFLRFCEDNDLLAGTRVGGEPVPVGWIAGPGDRTQRAEENLTAYFREQPTHNRRHWLQQGFRALAAQPAGRALVDPAHNPVWSAEISAEAAAGLIAFWRQTDSDGELVHDFTDPELDTRFLGDLYQDLSDHAKKTYALLQTPVFVEEFILDQTLTPAVREFGLEGLKLIDPTCGSGHFLLGAFERLNAQWQQQAPALDAKQRVRRVMDSIHGVDLNPFAVAIARFRLTVAGLKAAGDQTLVGLPEMGFHLAIGDSLLGEQGGVPDSLLTEDGDQTYFYDSEDLGEYTHILRPGKYHVVVGNPPYITPPDKAVKRLYRKAYETAHGHFGLSAPFMELFFRLAVRGAQGQGAGYVGQITSIAFMKREFGRKVVEGLFAGQHMANPVDLTKVVDSSGAYIPGHGTPTVIIFGRRRQRSSEHVRAVLGKRGEPSLPADPAHGRVWTEIVEHIGEAKFEGKFVSVADLPYSQFTSHPLSLSGGGATELKRVLEDAPTRLGSFVRRMGMFGDSHAEDYFAAPIGTFLRLGVASQDVVGAIDGDATRDWHAGKIGELFFAGGPAAVVSAAESSRQTLWPWRTSLWSRRSFSGGTYRDGRVDWLAWHQVSAAQGPRSRLVFAKIATHFSGALSRTLDVEKPGAIRIELPEGATEDEHLELLGVLNSSTACFWLKQVSYPKGGDPVGQDGARVSAAGWDDRYEFTGTKLEEFPLPERLPVERARMLDALAADLGDASPRNVVAAWVADPSGEQLHHRLESARQRYVDLRRRMVFEQEELDWEVYLLYGLIDTGMTYDRTDLDGLDLGERAFEVALARDVAAGEEETAWFERHGSTPLTDLPAHWPRDYSDLVQRRLDLMEADRSIRLLERPEFKRRWVHTPWSDQLEEALEEAILDRLEQPELWQDSHGPVARSVAELTDVLRADAVLKELAQELTGKADPDLAAVLKALVMDEAVPNLAAHRYKPSGLEKFREWQTVWDLQRREDAGKTVTIPVPPKYAQADFRRVQYWRARGKLDVPKERFILYPDLARNADGSPVLGWAGWSHRDQALALARDIATQEALGAERPQLVPIIAGLVELEPWLTQWHNEIEPAFGTSPAAVISGVVDQHLAQLEMTREQVTAWLPPAPTRGRRPRTA